VYRIYLYILSFWVGHTLFVIFFVVWRKYWRKRGD